MEALGLEAICGFPVPGSPLADSLTHLDLFWNEHCSGALQESLGREFVQQLILYLPKLTSLSLKNFRTCVSDEVGGCSLRVV